MKKQILFFLIIFACSNLVRAANGDLDTEFNAVGTGLETSRPGVRVDHFDGAATTSLVNGLVRQQDGKLVISGRTDIGGTVHIAVARFNTDGTYDISFGTGGKVVATALTNNTIGFRCALQPDAADPLNDKIVVVGRDFTAAPNEVVVIRYTASGVLDTTFNSGGATPGVFNANFGGSSNIVTAIAVDVDGKILVAGSDGTSPNSALVVRLKSDGTLDTTFGAGAGFVALNTGNGAGLHTAYDVLPLSSGKILVAGEYAPAVGNRRAFVLRLNSDGTLDTTFNNSGAIPGFAESQFDDVNVADDAQRMLLTASGLFLIGKGDGIGGIARFRSNGTSDTGFGSAGSNHIVVAATTDFYADGAISLDDKIIAVSRDGANTEISRMSKDGVLDDTFGTAGTIIVDINTALIDTPKAMVIQPDGNIVVAGDGTSKFFIARIINIVPSASLTLGQILGGKFRRALG